MLSFSGPFKVKNFPVLPYFSVNKTLKCLTFNVYRISLGKYLTVPSLFRFSDNLQLMPFKKCTFTCIEIITECYLRTTVEVVMVGKMWIKPQSFYGMGWLTVINFRY